MILTCPACGTRYTVKDGAIPVGGRQVRCANCKHSWHQDPAPIEDTEGQEATAEAAPASQPPIGVSQAVDEGHPSGDETQPSTQALAADHAHPDVQPDDAGASDPDASPLPGPSSSETERGWADAPARAADDDQASVPYPVASEPALSVPPIPITEETSGWVAPATEPADLDFAVYDSGGDASDGVRRTGLIAILAALVLITLIVAAFWFLAPASLKQRLGLAQATDTPLLVQVDQRNRRTLASGNQLLEVSGKVINPTDQAQTVPPLQAQLRSLDQQVVYRWTIPPPAPSLQPGTSASFNSAELNIPASAACLDVSFSKERAPDKPCTAAGDAGQSRAG